MQSQGLGVGMWRSCACGAHRSCELMEDGLGPQRRAGCTGTESYIRRSRTIHTWVAANAQCNMCPSSTSEVCTVRRDAVLYDRPHAAPVNVMCVYCPPAPRRYAVLYDRPQLACHLLRRGSAASRDRRGLTAAQLAAGRMCARDPDLAALLARHQQ